MPTPNDRDNRYYKATKKCLIILSVLLVLVVPIVTSVSAGRVGPAAFKEVNGSSIWLDGPAQAKAGETISYNIMTDVSGLYGTQFEISFDPAVLQVVGGKLTPGTCPQPDLVQINSANNSAGTIEYATTQINPTPPCNGGLVATLSFQVLSGAPASSTQVQFDSVIMGDINGTEIPVTSVDLDLEILGVTAEFSGTPIVGPPPLNVDFTNLSGGDYTSCTWDFGDNSGSSLCANQSHVYTDPGVYTVSLTVSGPDGSDSEIKVDYIVVWKHWVNLPVVLR